jgi:hypothetical protein
MAGPTRNLTQRLARMALLPAGLVAQTFAQASHPVRLLQPIARGRFAAVTAIQPKPTLKLDNLRQHGDNLHLLRRYHGNQLLSRGRNISAGRYHLDRDQSIKWPDQGYLGSYLIL